MKDTQNYQELYEQTKRELDQVKLINDELAKMACTIHNWSFADGSQNCGQEPNRLYKYCAKFNTRYIYGAGAKADRAVKALGDLEYTAFVVSDDNKKATSKDDHPILHLQDVRGALAQEDTILIVALNPKNTQAVLPVLAQADLNAIYFME